jgi:tetratricopeptide (TPR) repeat protein
LAFIAFGLVPIESRAQGLSGAPQLALVYNAIFDADFEAVPRLQDAACPPAPVEACQLLGSVATWWQLQIDPHNHSHDAAFRQQADAAVAAVEAWTQREPDRAEAWFYLGGALGVRAQWRVLRGERLAAARDGKRIKESLERSVMLDPSLQDAYVGIGLYHYYADVAPAAAKLLRWLLLLPGGDRTLGLQQVLKAKSAGTLLQDEADYQLQLMFLWYEKQPERAAALLTSLDERHPRNPHFLQQLAELQDYRLRDFDASRRSYEELLRRVQAGRINLPVFAEMHARLGIARLSLPQDAIAHLRRVIDARPTAPFGAVAQAHLQLGEVLDRLGRHTEAAAAYRDAMAASPSDDRLKIANAARRALRAR